MQNIKDNITESHQICSLFQYDLNLWLAKTCKEVEALQEFHFLIIQLLMFWNAKKL